MAERNPTPTIEDYLGIIFTLERDGEEVIGARLSELLEVSAPTVTVTLRRMIRDGWITMTPGKKIELSPKGVEAAKAVIRRHMLTEWMLAKILNLPWSKVHEEAHKIEHSISNEVELSLIDKLDDPALCPHGNPMPGQEALSSDWQPLANCQAGDKIIIERIHEFLEEDPVLMGFLETNQILPGRHALISEILPFNKTITLKNNAGKVTLGLDIAKNIFIEKQQ
ncbi:MAG: DtxR family transcriptional regulator, Mn-dependent transcriptional regulator [Chloroflexota bacterium]|nr:DtxR family transcriptional regulator, Mn-dependent transcriptional regulator [Chloroflexota bacterium]